MSDQVTQVPMPVKTNRFPRSLVRTVVIGLLLISLIPVLVIGTATYIRTRNALQQQTISQLASLSTSFSTQIEQLAATRTKALNEINQSPSFDANIASIFAGPQSSTYYFSLTAVTDYFNQYIQTPTEKIFDLVSIVDSAGTVLVSSNRDLVGTNLTDSIFIKSLYQTDQAVLAFNPGGLYPDRLVLINSKMYRNVAGAPGLTIIGFSTPVLPVSLLSSAQSFFDNAAAFYYAADRSVIALDPVSGSVISRDISSDQKSALEGYINTSGTGKDFQYQNFNQQQVFSYINKIPSVQSSLFIEVPRSTILARIESLLPFILLLLLGLILITGLVVFFGARSIVLPLVELANNAQTFAGGDWSFRVKVNRKDEIGLLAYSFNFMVDELTTYYRSLEDKVEARTKQLRVASDIAQSANSASNQSDVLKLTSQLINDKFDFSYNAVYLVDNFSKIASLIENNFKISDLIPGKNLRIPINPDSLVGWTASTKQPRLSENISLDNSITNKVGILNSSLSELTIPIVLDDQVVAVLDLQNDREKSFDNETIVIFTALVNQVSSGLRNIQAVEAAQVDLKENIALYKSSRKIANAQTVDEVNSYITDLFTQTTFVSIFFRVAQDQLQLMNITDPKGTRLDLTLRGDEIPFAKGLLRLQDEGVVILSELKTPTDYSNLSVFFERRGCQSVALLPVFSGDNLTSILAIGSRELEPISLLQMQPYGNLTTVIGNTLERINLLALLTKRVNELTTLSSIGQSAAKSTDLQELFLRLHDQILSSFGENIGFSVALNDTENQLVQIPYYFDADQVEIASYPVSDDLVSQVIKTQMPILHRDASALGLHAIDSPQKTLTAKSWLGIPLTISNKILGALILFDTSKSNRFTDDDMNLMTTLSPQIAASIQNAELLNSQREALLAYDQERFLLNALLENIPDQISFKNTNGEYLRVSNSVAVAKKISDPSLLIGTLETVPEGSTTDELDEESDSKIIETGVPQVGKIEALSDPNGNENWSLTSKIPLFNQEGSVEALLKISRDVTDLITIQKISKRRADQLLTASEIARETTTGTLDIDVTLKRLVDLVKTRFGFYHSSIFLLDAVRQFAVLRESTGEAGAQLKEASHKLAVGSSSIVGQATSRGIPVVVNDVTLEENYYPNPLLPKTRSELAIPLKIGDQIFGALDVQSEIINAFTQEDINILQVLADQLTVTIQNATLYSKTQQTLERHRLLHQITSSAGQSATIEDAIRNSVQVLHSTMITEKITYLSPDENGLLNIRAYSGYTSIDLDKQSIMPGTGLIGLAAKEQKPQRVNDIMSGSDYFPLSLDTRSILAVPVSYANVLLGVIAVESPNAGAFDESDQEIITTLANNLASIISNIQLVDQIRLQVERQRQLYEITSKIRRSVDIETIMRTSVTEICSALNIRKGSIQLNSSQLDPAEETPIIRKQEG
jgi:GAF domain-containing protein/HAMP domain-containing protein